MQSCSLKKWMNDNCAEEYLKLKKRYGYGHAVTRGGFHFFVEGDEKHNCVRCLGQTIVIKREASIVWLFGFSEMTTLKSDVTLITEKGMLVERMELPFVGGMEQIGWAHDREAILKNRRFTVVDAVTENGQKSCLYAYRIDLPKSFLQAVILPDCSLMCITALAVE